MLDEVKWDFVCVSLGEETENLNNVLEVWNKFDMSKNMLTKSTCNLK